MGEQTYQMTELGYALKEYRGEKQYDTNRIGTRYRGQRQYDTSVGDQMLPPGDEFACRFVGIAGRAACGRLS